MIALNGLIVVTKHNTWYMCVTKVQGARYDTNSNLASGSKESFIPVNPSIRTVLVDADVNRKDAKMLTQVPHGVTQSRHNRRKQTHNFDVL